MVSKTSLVRFAALFAAAALGFSCSTTRVLEDGQYRLAKNKVEITNDDRFNTKEVEKYIKQKSNSYLVFGWNPFLNLYNLSGRDTSRFSTKFFRKVGVVPVVYQPSQVEATKDNITRHLEYLGYYNSVVESNVEVKGRTVDVTYSVTLGKRYRIRRISFSVPEGEFEKDFYADTANVSVRTGDFLSEAALEEETERSAAYFRRHGYFGFTKNYYSFEADTLAHDGEAVLLMQVRNYTRNQNAENARQHLKYDFGNVSIAWEKELNFREKVLRDMNTIVPGSLYDERVVNTTYSRLGALNIFSGVNMALNPRDTSNIVDCDITLSRSRMQGFKVNLEGSTNSTGLIGVSPQLSYYHKNVFHGGERLNLSFLGNFQFKYDNRSIRSNEFGVSSSISFPEFLGLPNTMFKGKSVPRTEISSSYNFQSRPEYTRNMISAAFSYSGSLDNGRFYYQFSPIQAKIVRLNDIDPLFEKTLSGNPFMRDAYQNHFDVGSGAMIYYTTCSDLNPKVSYEYVRFQIDASGNVLGLFNDSMKTDDFGSRLVWGTPYSQYVRSEITLGKTVVFGRNDNYAIATRFLLGVGNAFGNSSALPFEKQFYSGGANSMRGWQARALGPGRSKPDSTFVIPSQTGDLKIEANLEYRFPLFWKLDGALFLDVGNIWTMKETDGDGGRHTQFKFSDLPETLAADWGLGVRIDLNFLILRLDYGMKLYDPSQDHGSRWYPFRTADKTRSSGSLHFGVGYPF